MEDSLMSVKLAAVAAMGAIAHIVVWLFVLFNMILPMMLNVQLGQILSMSLWNVVIIIAFWVVWLPLVIATTWILFPLAIMLAGD